MAKAHHPRRALAKVTRKARGAKKSALNHHLHTAKQHTTKTTGAKAKPAAAHHPVGHVHP